MAKKEAYISPAQLKIVIDILNQEGGAPGDSFHSWRCSDKDRYPEPCTCVEEVATEIVAALDEWLWRVS